MAGYGGGSSSATAEWMEQSPPTSPHHIPGSTSEAHFAPNLGPECQGDLVRQLKRKLEQAQDREASLTHSRVRTTAWLLQERNFRRAREKALLRERHQVETLTARWKPLCFRAMESYQESEERFRIVSDDMLNTTALIQELKAQLAIKQSALDHKDKAILALEGDKKAYQEEMRYVINGSITTLWEISEQVLDLTQDLQEFQLRSKNGEKVTAAATASPFQEIMPPTGALLACAEHVSKKINHAKAALDKACKEWRNAEAGLEITQTYVRKSMMASILGKEVPAAPPAAAASASGEGTSSAPNLDESME